MPSPEEIADEVKKIFQKTLKVEPEKLQPDTVLKDDLNLDSLDMIEVVYEVEDHFDVQIPEDSIKEIRTFQQVVDGLHEAMTSKG
ncbi:MAG: acyl carrier protein [Planctomycetota bacterium]|jgi:acyl carrier protein